jgi:hypothetical protein
VNESKAVPWSFDSIMANTARTPNFMLPRPELRSSLVDNEKVVKAVCAVAEKAAEASLKFEAVRDQRGLNCLAQRKLNFVHAVDLGLS